MDIEKLTEKVETLSISEKPLLIVDLNGFLIDREYKPCEDSNESNRIGNFLVWKRQGIDVFLELIFTHFEVAVWSSAMSHNVNPLVKYVFGDRKLLFVWDQIKCEKNPPLPETKKPRFRKNLSEVWKEFPQYDSSNTLIIDDTEDKMSGNPKSCWISTEKWNRYQVHNSLDFGRGVMLWLAHYLLIPSFKRNLYKK